MIFSGCAALGLLSSGGGSGANNANQPAVAAATSGPPPSIFDRLETSSQLYLLAPSALLDGNDRLDAKIVEMQCRYRTPDPPFFVPEMHAPPNWTFAGRMNEGADDREMQALEYRSWFGFGSPKQQLNSWPVNMATLSEMPMVYLDERLTLINSSALTDAQRKDLSETYIRNSRRIREAVHRLQSTYNTQTECAQN